MDDRELVARFEDCTLPPHCFHHRAHVRIAWIYLREHPLLSALTRFRDSIQRYAGSLGALAKYHETVTFAFVFLIHERMQLAPHDTFDAFAAANEDLFGDILSRYYSKDTLASEVARRTFVMPDAVVGSRLSVD
ncbi:MAG: hypothetical protein M3Q69_16685 [Acidobacteriota bacterium]|nr:hypothetical protein [Acidobacteriota bacterium]